MILYRHPDPSDAAAIACVHVETWRTAYAGIMDAAYLSGLSVPAREAHHRKTLESDVARRRYVVADDPARGVVGFACGWKNRDAGDSRFDAELYAIYVLAAYQGRGIGRGLAARLAERLASEGFRSMKLWVLEDNVPSRRFYESLGAKLAGEKKIDEIGGRKLVEVAYGWEDIAPLARLAT